MARDVCPSADLNESLGAANQRWKKVYVGEVVEEESNFISRLVTKLASKAAISVSSLSKESIFYRLLSYALDASGVEYNFNNANAWYICLGDLFGGLIIQGGKAQLTGTYTINTEIAIPFSFPLSLSSDDYDPQVTLSGYGCSRVMCGPVNLTASGFTVSIYGNATSLNYGTNSFVNYVVFGR